MGCLESNAGYVEKRSKEKKGEPHAVCCVLCAVCCVLCVVCCVLWYTAC